MADMGAPESSPVDDVVVRLSEGRGRGVFAERDFKPRELIERCPVLVLPGEQHQIIRRTVLAHYFFRWVEGTGVVAVALGYGSLYNHSRRPNALHYHRTEHNEILIVAYEPIRRGEEIFISYTKLGDKRQLWFDEIEGRPGETGVRPGD
jgi:hypothetical protein